MLRNQWELKKSFSIGVTNTKINTIYNEGLNAGAIGGKLLGAGGGGFMLLFVPPENQSAVRERLKKLVHVPFKFDNSGSRVVVYQPNGL